MDHQQNLAYDTAVDDYKADHKDARKRANEWKETKSKVFESVRGLCSGGGNVIPRLDPN